MTPSPLARSSRERTRPTWRPTSRRSRPDLGSARITRRRGRVRPRGRRAPTCARSSPTPAAPSRPRKLSLTNAKEQRADAANGTPQRQARISVINATDQLRQAERTVDDLEDQLAGDLPDQTIAVSDAQSTVDDLESPARRPPGCAGSLGPPRPGGRGRDVARYHRAASSLRPARRSRSTARRSRSSPTSSRTTSRRSRSGRERSSASTRSGSTPPARSRRSRPRPRRAPTAS